MPTSSYEQLTIRALTALFPGVYWQERVRPDWLRWPTTGNALELDLWHPDFKLAIEIQGPHHYRSVAGLASAEQSQRQQDRDTYKRLRCAELGIKLWTVSIFDLNRTRLYALYTEIQRAMPMKRPPLTFFEFVQVPEVQRVVDEASHLSSRPLKPWSHTPALRKRLPGFGNLLRRMLHVGGYRQSGGRRHAPR